MKLERITAESWVNAFGIMLLMNAAGAAISGIIYLLLGAFAPMGSDEETVVKFVSLGMGVIALIVAPLIYLWGRALWERKAWSKTLVVIASWLAALLAVLLVVMGIVMLGAGPVESQLVGMLLLVLSVVLGAYAGFVIWLFMQPDVDAVFMKPQAFAWGTETRAAIVRAWALILWLSAATMALAGAIVLIASPFVSRIAASLGIRGLTAGVTLAVVIGIGLLLIGLGIIMHFVSKGLWGFRNWARIVLIAFAWLSALFALAGFIMSLVQYEDIAAVADALSNLIYGGGLAALQIWFLSISKDLFDAPAAPVQAAPKAASGKAAPTKVGPKVTPARKTAKPKRK